MQIYKSRRVIFQRAVQPAAIFTENGKIIRVETGNISLPADGNYSIYDAGDALIMPGLVDTHVHINEPGRTEWEGFETATRAAAAGGICTLVDMPLNSSPVTAGRAELKQKLAHTDGKLTVNCGFWGGLTPDSISRIDEMADAGVLGYKSFLIHSGIDEFGAMLKDDLEKSCPLIAKTGLPFLVHAETEIPDFTPPAYRYVYRDFTASRPPRMETEAIRMMLDLCRRFRFRLHIVHLATAEALPMLCEAKAEGLPLTVETCPHYLYFAAENIPDKSPQYKCCPPIRDERNRLQLWEAVKNGTIDLIASDHSPAPASMKSPGEGDLSKAWGGVSSLQFTLPVILAEAEKQGVNLIRVSELLCTAPAKLAGMMQKGVIAEGYDADLVIADDHTDYTPTESDILYRHAISPYLGYRLKGKVKATVLGGKIIYENGKFPLPPQGRPILRH